jgi:hypothetical protein
MQIEMLLPNYQVISLKDLRPYLAAGTETEPFAASMIELAADFSQHIFHDPEARKYPELLALAYWMRKTEIARLAAQFRSLQLEQRLLAPRGLIFHLPPRNVDTMFVYSWLLAALTGNRNVIRLSPERSEAINILVRLLQQTLAAAPDPTRNATVIVSYGHEAEPTEMLSALCDVRVIWGGDRTVETIRLSPLAPHAREITFPDRYSLTAIAAEAYEELTTDQRDCVAGQFFNDAYWFDQMGCSSPRLVVWCGQESSVAAASADFFPRVAGCVESRRYILPTAATMQKLVYTCSAILDLPISVCRRYPGMTVLTLDSLDGFRRDHPGGGLFFEARLESLSDLVPFLIRRDQTLTWFGFTSEELRTLVRRLNGRAIERVVPIGQALQFQRFWDGYDLLQEFCRCVYVECGTVEINAPQRKPAVSRAAKEGKELEARPSATFASEAASPRRSFP